MHRGYHPRHTGTAEKKWYVIVRQTPLPRFRYDNGFIDGVIVIVRIQGLTGFDIDITDQVTR